jgi:dipeptidyl aminopeptidase/acylaminoacyl peptidase
LEAHDLTGSYDIHPATGTIGDLGEQGIRSPLWDVDGERIYFQIARHGLTTLVSVDRANQNLETVIDTIDSVGDFCFDSEQSRVAYVASNFFEPGQIAVQDVATGSSRALTRFNDSWLRNVDLGELEEVWVKGADKNDLQGWILKPPGFRSSRKYSSILEIHGGPLAQYGDRMMHEFLFLGAQGYVVHFTNPRGGQGYGEAHAKAIYNRWGTADYADLMAWTNTIARRPYIDSSRMGVMGGSYGGYSTCWIVGQTKRFKAAVTLRCVSNFVSMWGSSDMNWRFQRLFGSDSAPWEDLENYWRQSPMKHVGNVKTPTLVIHSEQDLRCDIEQSEQFYVAPKRLGVDTEFVVFPEESHELSRSGRTDRRVERLKHMARWFGKYL